MFKLMNNFKNFLKDEEGSGVVEMVLIIVVLIMIVVIFRDQLKTLVNTIFKRITNDANAV